MCIRDRTDGGGGSASSHDYEYLSDVTFITVSILLRRLDSEVSTFSASRKETTVLIKVHFTSNNSN